MKTKQIHQTIAWAKRIAAVATVAVWVYVMSHFIQDPAPFRELATYCMGSTILIFGILTGIFKGLECWEKKVSSE